MGEVHRNWREWQCKLEVGQPASFRVPAAWRTHVFWDALRTATLDLPSGRLITWVRRLTEDAVVGEARAAWELAWRTVVSGPRGAASAAQVVQAALRHPERAEWELQHLLDGGDGLRSRLDALREAQALAVEQIGWAVPWPDGLATPVDLATRWLALTDDLAATVRCDGWQRWLHVSLGLEATEGWPARLTERSLSDWLRMPALFEGVSLRSFSLPQVFGASSYTLALWRLGRAWSDALTAPALPFALQRDPWDLARERHGASLAMLPLLDDFARRRQGLTKEGSRAQRRKLASAWLLQTRLCSMRVLLASVPVGEEGHARQLQQELSQRVLGWALPARTTGLLPRYSEQAAPRLLGTLLAASEHLALESQWDSDWFLDPRRCEEWRASATRHGLLEEPCSVDALYELLSR